VVCVAAVFLLGRSPECNAAAPPFADKSEGAMSGTLPAMSQSEEDTSMNLVVGLPAMFLLGMIGMGLCYAFIVACEKI